jgi:hypothetical protein
MAIPVWHQSLPQKPLMAGFKETRQNIVARSQTDTGPAKARRRVTIAVITFEMQFRMSAAQLATFRTLYAVDFQSGALPYSWKHPVTNAAGLFRVVDPPTIVPAGASWLVGLNVEMLP